MPTRPRILSLPALLAASLLSVSLTAAGGCKPKAVRGGPGTENPNLDQGAMSTTLDRRDPRVLQQMEAARREILARAYFEKVGEGGALTVSFAGKGRHFAVPAGYRCFVHGYAITADKSQGKTTAHVIVAGQKIDGKRLYVATSRGRKSVELHVPDKARLLQETPRQIENRPAALDFVTRKKGIKTMAPTQAPRPQESRVHVWAEKARERCRQFLDLAQRWLRLEVQTLKESQAEERRRELERRIERPIIQELQPQLELAQKHAHQQRYHGR